METSKFIGELPNLSFAEGTSLRSATFGGPRYGQTPWALIAPNAKLARTCLLFATFDGAALACADFTGSDMRKATFRGSGIEGSIMSGADLEKAQFRDTNLDRVDLSGASLVGAKFTDSQAVETDFTDADLTGVDLTGCDITSAVFDGAIVDGVVVGLDQLLAAPSLLERILRTHIEARGGMTALVGSGPVTSPTFKELTVRVVAT